MKKSIPNKLVRCIFELRALQIEGEYPGVPANEKLKADTVYAMDFISESPLSRLYSFSLSDEVLSELALVTYEYRNKFIDRPLKSLEMLETFEY